MSDPQLIQPPMTISGMVSDTPVPDQDHIHADPGPMYEKEWVKKLLRQIQHCLQINSSWLGIEKSKPQRVLDYGCGNGTVSSALLSKLPETTFQGLDIAISQVKRFNDEANRLLGESHNRMFAIQGDLNDPGHVLSEPEWRGFDAAITSFALHHVKDPAGYLTLLRDRVRQGGVVVVVDFLRESSITNGNDVNEGHKYDPANMIQVPEGHRIWPGFTVDEMRANMTAAGCADFELRVYPEQLVLPNASREYSTMFIAKATVT